MNIKDKLISAVTAYDKQQSKKRDYNHYALGAYFERVDLIVADIEAGMEPKKAIEKGFSDRLLDHCLRFLGIN